MPAAILLLIGFCLLLSRPDMLPAARAFENSYLPLDRKLLSRRVPQKLQADPLQAGQAVNVGKTRIEIVRAGSDSRPGFAALRLQGTDSAGKSWYYRSSARAGYASVWSADLDKNGREDLLILLPTGACKPAPGAQLLVLLFEKDGRPFPFAVDGYFEVDSRGIKDFIDLENDGRSELVRQSLADGYWLTSFYEARASRFHLLKAFGGMKLPLYNRFTLAENHCPVRPSCLRHPCQTDLSNCLPGFSAGSPLPLFLDVLDWPAGGTPCLLFSDGRRMRLSASCSPLTVVIDEAGRRRMASFWDPEAVQRLLSEIRLRRLPVSLCPVPTKAGGALSCPYIISFSRSPDRNPPNCANPGRSLELALFAASACLELP